MAFKISDSIKTKLNTCCKACIDSEFGTRLQNLGDDLDSATTELSEKFTAAELAKLGSMCEGNKIVAAKFNLLVDKLLDVTKADISPFTRTEVDKIDNSCNSFSGIGTLINTIVAKINVNEVGAVITIAGDVIEGGVDVTASTEESGTLTWISSNELIATVVEETGVITPILEGTTNITYLSDSGMTNTITVAVESNFGEVITFSAAAIAGGETITAASEETGTLAWSSSDPLVATIVGATGVITPLTAGTTDIIYLSDTAKTSTKVLTVTTE